MRQESAFNPHVVSSANAYGLMQVTPDAGRDTAKRFNVTFNQRRLPTTSPIMPSSAPRSSAKTSPLGAAPISSPSSPTMPDRAGRKEWIEQYGDPRDPKVDPIDWIERIPISETRNYVERVIENMQVYRALVENNPKLSIEADLRRGG